MLSKNTAQFISEAERHVDADLVRGGWYKPDENGKACFIGCHTGGNYPIKLEEMYGIPLMLIRVAEEIFEQLPSNAAADAVIRQRDTLLRLIAEAHVLQVAA